MRALTAMARAVTTVNLWVGRIMAWVVLALFMLLLLDVAMRYVAGSPIQWSQQLSRLLFGVYAIIGGGYLLARREHVNVDLFYATFSRRRQAAVDLATSFLFFFFVVILLRESWSLAADSVARWEVDHLATWKAPLWPSKSLIVVAAALLLLQGIVKLAADIMILAGIEVDESAFGPIHNSASIDERPKEGV
jgi:TRAP-type mannitol/chloroaromatic compound transport system permease small subunit